jgi:hypothetical protein
MQNGRHDIPRRFLASHAAAFGVGTTTAHRYVTEAVELLAALTPSPADALQTAPVKAFVILDGTPLPIDRIAADRPFYSGCWANKGYRGAGGPVRIPRWGRRETLSTGQKAMNRSHAKIRALAEPTVATRKSWRLLRKLRCSTTRTTKLIQAAPTLRLTNSERGWRRLNGRW